MKNFFLGKNKKAIFKKRYRFGNIKRFRVVFLFLITFLITFLFYLKKETQRKKVDAECGEIYIRSTTKKK